MKDPILERRSIRTFTSETVSEEDARYILRAAMSAPSADNERPWHFVVIRERFILDEIMKVHPYSKMLAQAQLAFLVCGDEALEVTRGYWVQDCAAAVENMLIAVQSRGLGGVWLGVHPQRERVEGIRKILDIPTHITPFALVAVGYPAENKPYVDRYDATRVHDNGW